MTTRTWIISLAAVLVGWIMLQLSVMYFTDAAPGAVVVFSDKGFVERLPAGAAIVDIGRYWVTVSSDKANLAKDLYAAGAWVVLPAGLSGCLPLSLS